MSELPPILVAVVSAPRPRPTLSDTLASLARAGFPAPLVVYDADRAGCWQNWRRAGRLLLECHARRPDLSSCWALVCEDDMEIVPDATQRLPVDRCSGRGVYSLYTAAPNHREATGWYALENLPHDASGALAYLLPCYTLGRLLADPPHPEWADRTDHAVGLFCRDHDLPYWVHSLSLVRHAAVEEGNSALRRPGGTPEGRQCAAFAGDAHYGY